MLPVAILGTMLIFGATLTQGWTEGFVNPISGTTELGGQEYFHDAVDVTGAISFVRTFEDNQSSLRIHSRTHPPGAVLVIYGLRQLFANAGVIGIVIGLLGSTAGLFLYGVIDTVTGDSTTAGWTAMLFFLLPGVEIYQLATLDALISSCIVGAVYFFIRPASFGNGAAWVTLLVIASTLTFAVTFALPILGLIAWMMGRTMRLVWGLATIAAIYVLIAVMLDFNYLASFREATQLENAGGPLFLTNPSDYILTRLEGIAELLLFFGPLPLLAMAVGFSRVGAWTGNARTWSRSNCLAVIAASAVGTWMAMLATGAFRVGETGRACQFLYPFLLCAVAAAATREKIERLDRQLILSGTFGLALGMQLFGNYFW